MESPQRPPGLLLNNYSLSYQDLHEKANKSSINVNSRIMQYVYHIMSKFVLSGYG